MKLNFIFIFFLVIFGIYACENPCYTETPPQPACIDQVLGNIPLNDAYVFLNHPSDSNDFELINEKGDLLSIKNIQDTTVFIGHYFKSYSKNPDKCNYIETCFNTANICYEYNRFKGEELPYQLAIIRYNSNIVSVDSFKTNTSWRFKDQAAIGINYTFIDLPINNPKISTFRYLDTITFNHQLYRQVYHVWLDSNVVNYHNDLSPIGAFFNLEKGILGFYLSNGQTWLRK